VNLFIAFNAVEIPVVDPRGFAFYHLSDLVKKSQGFLSMPASVRNRTIRIGASVGLLEL